MNATIIIRKAADRTARLNAHLGEGSKRHFMLMEHDYITLKFSTDTPTLLHLGDYVEIENVGRYELTEPTRGELNRSTGGYDYEIRLEAQYWKFKNKLCKFLPQIGSNETSWNYTDTLPNHAQQILFNIRAQVYERDSDDKEVMIAGRQTFLYNGVDDWRIEWDETVDTTKAITIQYDSKNIIDAISAIAEAFDCEWWFEQNVLHFGKCQYGTKPVRLEVGRELVEISRTDSKENYATRIYAYGSDRNIASNYRKSLVFDAKVNGGMLHDPEREIEIGMFYQDLLGSRSADPSKGHKFTIPGWKKTRTGDQVSSNGSSSGKVRVTAYGYIMSENFRKADGVRFTVDKPVAMGKGTLSFNNVTVKVTPTALRPVNVRELEFGDEITAEITLVYADTVDFDDNTPFDTIKVRAAAKLSPIGQPTEIRFNDTEIQLEREAAIVCISSIGFEIDCRASSNTQYSKFGDFDWSGEAAGTIALSSYPEWKATGITIEVLDKKTGEIDHTIEGAIFNASYETSRRKLTLPNGAAINTGDKYRLPQLNKAVVPARYFTSIYTVFEKYKDVTTNGIVNNRLLLPEKDEDGNPIKGYIDVIDFEAEEEAVEDVVVFEDVYPSRISKIETLMRSDEYTTDQDEQDGSTTRTTYREFIYQDDLFGAGNPFDRDNYLDGTGNGLKITFQSGLLNGMTFDVELLEDSYSFQIKRDGTTQLPNEVIKPKIGDEFILHGFNIAMLSDGRTDYIANAERELLAKAREYAAKLNTDASTYQCTVACDLAYEVEKDSPDGLYLGIGRRVLLIHPGYFKDGRVSRVLGYEVALDYSYDNPVYFIGEKASYSRLGAIEDRLDGIGNTAGNFGAVLGGGDTAAAGTGGNAPYVIQQLDPTPPTDKNVYSALRSRLEFVMRNVRQTIKHIWTFLAGIRIGTFIEGQSGAQIDAAGNAEVESITVRSWLKVQELIYNRLNAIEGDTSFADVGTIEQLTNNIDGTQTALMRRRWDGDITTFQPGDVVYGYVNELDRADVKESHKAWAWIKSVDRAANQLTLATYTGSETPSGTNHPMTEGMIISRWGNNIEPSLQAYTNSEYSAVIGKRGDNYINKRQRSFFISCDSGNLVELMGVNKPKLESANYGTILGNIPEGLLDEKTEELINKDQPYLYARGILVQDLIRIGYDGLTVRTQNYRGEWRKATAEDDAQYYRNTKDTYDAVTWRGAMWQNLSTKSVEEPRDGSADWLRMTGSSAEVRGLWRIVPSAQQIRIDKNGKTHPEVLTCEVWRSALAGDNHYATGAELEAAGAELWVSVDGNGMKRFIMGSARKIVTMDGRQLTMRSGKVLRTQGDDMAVAGIEDMVVFELRDSFTGKTLDRATVTVIRDGEDGEPGAPGTAGPMVYPAGIWNEQATYTSTGGALPCVQYNGQFYVLRSGLTKRGLNPAQDYATNGAQASWQLMDKMQYVFADVLMANFAKLGAAVFYGDFMFSQDGTINGEPVSGLDANGVAYYTRFVDGKSAGSFIPNVCVNFKSGYLGAAVGVFSGAIRTVFKPISESDAIQVAIDSSAEPYISGPKYELRNDVNLTIDRTATSMHVVLPVSEDYIGARVVLSDSYGLFAPAPNRITVSTSDGSYIGGIASADRVANLGNFWAKWVQIYGGMIELVCLWSGVPGVSSKPAWAVFNHRCRGIIGIYQKSGLQLLTTEYWNN